MRVMKKVSILALLWVGCSAPGGGDFSDKDITPSENNGTPTPEVHACAPSLIIDESALGLYYDDSFRAYISVPMQYELVCGQIVGARIDMTVSYQSGSNQVSESAHYFIHDDNEHAYVDLNAAKIYVHVDVDADPSSEWTLNAQLVDSLGYRSEGVEFTVIPQELDEVSE